MNRNIPAYDAYTQDPLQQALAKLRQLEEENLTLRNQLFTSNDEIFQLQATIATIEVEAKFQATQEVNNIQSQLKFKEKEFEEKNRDHKRLLKELNELKKERGLLSSSSPTFSQPINSNTISQSMNPPMSHHPQLDKSSSVASKKRKSDDISSAQASSRSSGPGIDRDSDNFTGSSSNPLEKEDFKRQEMEIKNKIELDTMNDLLKEFHQLLLLMTQTNTSTVSNNESTDSNEMECDDGMPSSSFRSLDPHKSNTPSTLKNTYSTSTSTPPNNTEASNSAIISSINLKSSGGRSLDRQSTNNASKLSTAEKCLAQVTSVNIHHLLSNINHQLHNFMHLNVVQKESNYAGEGNDDVETVTRNNHIFDLTKSLYDLCRYYWEGVSSFLLMSFPLEGVTSFDNNEEVLVCHLVSCVTSTPYRLVNSYSLASNSFMSEIASALPTFTSSGVIFDLFILSLKMLSLFIQTFLTEDVLFSVEWIQGDNDSNAFDEEINMILGSISIPLLPREEVEKGLRSMLLEGVEKEEMKGGKKKMKLKEEWRFFFHGLIDWMIPMTSLFYQLSYYHLPKVLKYYQEQQRPDYDSSNTAEKPKPLIFTNTVIPPNCESPSRERMKALSKVMSEYWCGWILYLQQQTITSHLEILQTLFVQSVQAQICNASSTNSLEEGVGIMISSTSFTNIFLPLFQLGNVNYEGNKTPPVKKPINYDIIPDYFFILIASSFTTLKLKEDSVNFLRNLLTNDERLFRSFIKYQTQYTSSAATPSTLGGARTPSAMKRGSSDGHLVQTPNPNSAVPEGVSSRKVIVVMPEKRLFYWLSGLLWHERKFCLENLPSHSNQAYLTEVYRYHIQIIRFFHGLLMKYEAVALGAWLQMPYDVLFSLDEGADDEVGDGSLFDEAAFFTAMEEEPSVDDSVMDVEDGSKKSTRPPALQRPSASSSKGGNKVGKKNRFCFDAQSEIYLQNIDRQILLRFFKSWSYHWLFFDRFNSLDGKKKNRNTGIEDEYDEDDDDSIEAEGSFLEEEEEGEVFIIDRKFGEEYIRYLLHTTRLINDIVRVIGRRSYQHAILTEGISYIGAFLGRLVTNRFPVHLIPWKKKDIQYIDQPLHEND